MYWVAGGGGLRGCVGGFLDLSPISGLWGGGCGGDTSFIHIFGVNVIFLFSKFASDIKDGRVWSFGKDQSLSGLESVGGLAVEPEHRDSLEIHIKRLTELWKNKNQSIIFFPNKTPTTHT